MKIDVLYEDNHVIAVNKPAGMLSQPDSSGQDSVIEHVKTYIKKKYARPGNVFLGTVHRLDRPVTGVMLMARTSKAASRLSGQMRERAVIKIYVALVHGEAGTGDGWIELRDYLKREGNRTVVSSPEDRTRESIMRYRRLYCGRNMSLILIRLLTGRKHQIRAQLARAGMPVVGDTKYGSQEKLNKGNICLHSLIVRFRHPVRDVFVNVTASVPEFFSSISGFEILNDEPAGWVLQDLD